MTDSELAILTLCLQQRLDLVGQALPQLSAAAAEVLGERAAKQIYDAHKILNEVAIAVAARRAQLNK